VNRDAVIAVLRSRPLADGRVRQIAVPASARALSTLARVDYADAFLVDVPVGERTADGWARQIFEEAPAATRHGLWAAWTTLGVQRRSGPRERVVFGWDLRRFTPDVAVLATRSRLGIAAELLVERRSEALLFCTLVHQRNRLGRAAWPAVEAMHRPVVRAVLESASRRARTAAPGRPASCGS
jgi:hypothetical protein